MPDDAGSPQPSRPERPLALDPKDAGAPLGEATYRTLCRALRDGVFEPGDRLREEDVARRLAVSRTPVREAFGRLLGRRLVESAGGRGLIVRRLEATEALELYALREILEGAAARLAAQHASRAEVEMMEEIEAALEAAPGDAREMGRLNRMLHETIFRAARNRYLDVALQDMQDAISLLGPTTFGVQGRPETASSEHRAMIAAIRDRDPDAAETAARDHMRSALKARLRILQG
ncbi:MAG: GntR family transcriptional regulator [Rhizobiales bacterium]|nr:GntR family transcriptional regulator [Hyphomicrobiales bacterium]